MKYNKINIYLRQFSRNRPNPDRPKWFDYEKTFRNLLSTANKDLCNITICFEKQEDYPDHFVSKYDGPTVTFIDTNKENFKQKTFEDANWSRSVAATSNIIAKDISCGVIKNDELIYILEDDYLHLPNWSEITLDLFDNFLGDNDYVCLYDHADKYLFTNPSSSDHWGMYKDLTSKIIVSNGRHWRSLPNCGLSMIMSVNLFKRDLTLWTDGYSDCEIGHQISKNHGTKIWTPMPSLNTHCIHPFVSPLIDWEKVIG